MVTSTSSFFMVLQKSSAGLFIPVFVGGIISVLQGCQDVEHRSTSLLVLRLLGLHHLGAALPVKFCQSSVMKLEGRERDRMSVEPADCICRVHAWNETAVKSQPTSCTRKVQSPTSFATSLSCCSRFSLGECLWVCDAFVQVIEHYIRRCHETVSALIPAPNAQQERKACGAWLPQLASC